MVKELNNMKNKKSNSYKPYDSSNSFVRRVTSRVSQLLPQPTSWISRFLNRPPEQAGPFDTQDGEEEEVVQAPASKRMRTVQTCTDFPVYHNSVGPVDNRRLEERREEVLSPIRCYKFPSVAGPSRSHDLDAPGPSGLSSHPFVASTPAALPQPQIQPKVNGDGDDGSDSDSASHASSIPPEPCEQQPQSLFRSLKKPRFSHRLVTDEHNSNLLKSKQLKLDLSTSSLSSSRGLVSFDTTVFNSPFKGRLCGGLSVSRDETSESPFYRSNTTFGGASSCNDSLLRTRSLHSEVPIVIQPSQPHRVSDNLGSSAKKILKALEQFSAPMLDQSRRVQPRDRGLKRKVEIPYKELVIPQMPDLLRIKRRESKRARYSLSSAPHSVKNIEPVPSLANETASTTAEAVASQSSSSQLSQRLSKPEEIFKNRVEALPEKKSENSKKIKESLVMMPSLSITTLPKFDTGLVKQAQTVTLPPLTAPIMPTSSQFVFSKPINITQDSSNFVSIPPTKKFSLPLDPDSKVDNKSFNCVNSAPVKEVEMTYVPPSSTKLKRKELPSTDAKAASEFKTGSVLDILSKYTVPTSTDIKSGSVADIFKSSQETVKKATSNPKWECQGCYVANDNSKTNCVACDQARKPAEKKETLKGFGDKFKMSTSEWECDGCLVRNNIKDSKCLACGQTNSKSNTVNAINSHKPVTQSFSGFGDKFKRPAGSWDCNVCLVQNKAKDTKCISCSTDKPGAVPSKPLTTAPPLSNLFKKPAGSWECDACLVRNTGDVTTCVSCGTVKPGAKPSQATPTFSFGIPPASEASPKFSFGVSSTSVADTPAKNTFISSSPATQPVKPTFTFGIPSVESDKKVVTTTESNFIFSSVKNNSDIDCKSNAEASTDSGKNTLQFPKLNSNETKPDVEAVQTLSAATAVKKDSGIAVSLESSAKSIFGNVTTSAASTIATTTSVNSSSVTPSSLPIFVNQISSTKCPTTSTEKITAPNSAPIFTFGAASSSVPSLGSITAASESVKPPDSSLPVFGSGDDQVKPMATSPVNKTTAFSLNNTDNKTSEVKPNLFTFGSSTAVDKKPFFNSKLNDTTSTGFNSNPANSFVSQSSSAPVTLVFAYTGGCTQDAPTNQLKTDSNANSFTSQPPQQQTSAVRDFTFTHPRPNWSFVKNKTDPGATPFEFGSATTNHTNSFSSATTAANQFNSNFTTTASSPFSTQGSIFGSSAPQPAQTASFLFGASQSNDRPPPAPTFNFAAQSGNTTINSVGNTSVAGGFAFGQTQNSAPVQPPAFDPNIKPVFNFSGGQTQTFSATPSTEFAVRKIRKAVRRTTQK